MPEENYMVKLVESEIKTIGRAREAKRTQLLYKLFYTGVAVIATAIFIALYAPWSEFLKTISAVVLIAAWLSYNMWSTRKIKRAGDIFLQIVKEEAANAKKDSGS